MTTLAKVAAGTSALVAAGALGYAGIGLLKDRQPGAALPPPPAVADVKPQVQLVTHWSVRYKDATLGTVEGRAVVDWERSKASVTFEDAGGKAILAADDVTIDKSATTVTMRLRGRSPEAPAVAPPSTAGMKRVATAEGQSLTVTPSEPSFSSEVKEKADAEADGVHLLLRAGPYGALRGEWSYLADPLTQRNAGGAGRTGYFHLLRDDEGDDPRKGFLGLQSGPEEWWPLPAEIVLTTVMEEQLAGMNRFAEYYYPYSGSRLQDPKVTTRTLFVVGRHLPVDRGKVMQSIRWSGSDNLQAYRVVALSTDPDITAEDRKRIEDGWKKVTQALDDVTAQEARRVFDAALVVVELKEGVLAGPKQFDWGEATSSWFLQFGDNIAEARFVRPLRMKTAADATSSDEYEQTPWVFLPERIAVEVDPRVVLPLDSIPVRIATRAAPAAQTTLIARRVAGEAFYRTELIRLSNGGQPNQGTLALRPGDELIATVQTDDVQFVEPPLAFAKVLLTPDRLEDIPKNPKEKGPQVRLWKEALVLAARANNVAVTDASTLPGHKLAPYRGIPMTVGDHAAMLLLRSAFLDMMRQQLDYLDKIDVNDDDQVEGFHEWVRRFMVDHGALLATDRPPVGWETYPEYLKVIDELQLLRQFIVSRPIAGVKLAIEKLKGRESGFGKGTYFGELPVPGPAGGEWEYFTTYWESSDPRFQPFFQGDARKHREWRLEATRTVITRYRSAVKTTIDTVTAIPDTDRVALLKLTGIGFGAVISRVIPQLMRLDDSTGVLQWVPDYPARGAVANLHAFGEAVRASEDYSSLKDQAVLEIAGALLAWGAPGLILSEATAAAVSTVTGLGLLAWQAGGEVYNQYMVRRDLDLFFGASAVLGVAQLEEVNAQKVSITDVVLQVAVHYGISTIWGEMPEPPASLPPPKQQVRSLWRFAVVPVFAAPPPPNVPRPVRPFSTRIAGGINVILAEGEVQRLAAQPRIVLRPSAKAIQGLLRLAQQGGTNAKIRGISSLKQMTATAIVRRLSRQISEGPAPSDSPDAIAFGRGVREPLASPAPQPRPAPPLPPRLPPVPERPAATALPRQYPGSGNPPGEGAIIRVVEADGKEVFYKSEPPAPGKDSPKLGSGASADVYAVADVRYRSRDILAGEGVVIKVMKHDWEMGKPREQILRIKEANELVKSLGIEHAAILEFHENANPPYLIQRRVRPGNRVKVIEPEDLVSEIKRPPGYSPVGIARPYSEIARIFTEDLQAAVVELYHTLAIRRAISPDLSLKNLYFKYEGGKWIAGLLDIDHVAHIKRPRSNATWKLINEIVDNPSKIGSLGADNRALTTSFTFMEKVLEHEYGGNLGLPWIVFDQTANVMRPVLMNPELARRFGEFQMRPGPRPAGK